MQKGASTQSYHSSLRKRFLDITVSLVTLIILSPLIMAIPLLVRFANNGPTLFKQKRVGKNGKVFTLIKFRTMHREAERERNRYLHLNEAGGPVFKIFNDPRYTKFGKILARTGLDELPQLINVLKGEMSLVGPRPLPIYEAKKLTGAQKIRELVKPGITSSWIVSGAHSLTFTEWMRLDRDYVENGSLSVDIQVLVLTAMLVLKSIPRQLLKTFFKKS